MPLEFVHFTVLSLALDGKGARTPAGFQMRLCYLPMLCSHVFNGRRAPVKVTLTESYYGCHCRHLHHHFNYKFIV